MKNSPKSNKSRPNKSIIMDSEPKKMRAKKKEVKSVHAKKLMRK